MGKATIEDHAKAAKFHHEAVIESMRAGLRHVRLSGQALIKAHKIIGKPGWKAWLADNWPASYELACTYMKIARGWKTLLKRYNSDLSELSIEGALQELRVKRLKKEFDETWLTEKEKEWHSRLDAAESRLRQILNEKMTTWRHDGSGRFLVFVAEHSFILDTVIFGRWLDRLREEIEPIAEVLPPVQGFNTDYSRLPDLQRRTSCTDFQRVILDLMKGWANDDDMSNAIVEDNYLVDEYMDDSAELVL